MKRMHSFRIVLKRLREKIIVRFSAIVKLLLWRSYLHYVTAFVAKYGRNASLIVFSAQ